MKSFASWLILYAVACSTLPVTWRKGLFFTIEASCSMGVFSTCKWIALNNEKYHTSCKWTDSTMANTTLLEWINLQSTAKFSSARIFNESHIDCIGISGRWSKPTLVSFFFFSHPLINTQYLLSTRLSDDENPVPYL